jgi:hypothetical protein
MMPAAMGRAFAAGKSPRRDGSIDGNTQQMMPAQRLKQLSERRNLPELRSNRCD